MVCTTRKPGVLSILFVVVLLAVAVMAEAQQRKKVPRLGYLSGTDPDTDSTRIEAIRLALRERGYIEGQNIAIEYRYAEGKRGSMDDVRIYNRALSRSEIESILSSAGSQTIPPPPPVGGQTLRVLASNPRYFTDGSGKAVYLTGSNYWANLQDVTNPTEIFDWTGYLNLLTANNHNFIRLWVIESPKLPIEEVWDGTIVSPMPYARSNTCCAEDGGNKFDLNQFNEAYFDRLRSRVQEADSRGIYVSVMLFQGWNVYNFKRSVNSWIYNPLNGPNNINGIAGDSNGDGRGEEVHRLGNSTITSLQEKYVRKVIDTVGDLDNVLYEIANEDQTGSESWQSYMVNYIHSYESGKPLQHPVGMSSFGSTNAPLIDGPAEWISPGSLSETSASISYLTNPPTATGNKVIILDSDHIGWDVFANDPATGRAWAWKSITRGYNSSLVERLNSSNSGWVAARKAMGDTRTYANKMNLAAMTPQGSLTSTGYALASPGSEYLVYQPSSGSFTVNLAQGTYSFEWFNPTTGSVTQTGTLTAASGNRSFTPPFSGDAVLYMKNEAGSIPPPPPPQVPPPPASTKFNIGDRVQVTAKRCHAESTAEPINYRQISCGR